MLPDAGRVLDLGCGPGHYAARLAASGIDAIGIDVDAETAERWGLLNRALPPDELTHALTGHRRDDGGAN